MKLLPLFLCLALIVAIELFLALGLPRLTTEGSYTQNQLTYQVARLGLSLLVIALVGVASGTPMTTYLRIGDLNAPTQAVPLLGIKATESWHILGRNLAIVITLITATVVYVQLKPSLSFSLLLPVLPWIVLFSLTNAFSEEIMYRFGIISTGAGVVPTPILLLISGAVFGIMHLRGIPGGVAGAMFAGLLGWVLAKSVVETHGIFWAWFIHFLQDVVIFSAIFLGRADA